MRGNVNPFLNKAETNQNNNNNNNNKISYSMVPKVENKNSNNNNSNNNSSQSNNNNNNNPSNENNREKEDSDDEEEGEQELISMIVTNLAAKANRRLLRGFFEPYGATRCRLLKKNGKHLGIGLVKFNTLKDAEEAVKFADKKVILEREISCRVATPEDLSELKKDKPQFKNLIKQKE
jgi:RNA recognition motif-containing protein